MEMAAAYPMGPAMPGTDKHFRYLYHGLLV